MRTLFFLAVVTAIATVSYNYGPYLFGSDTPHDKTSWVPTLGDDDKDAVAAGLNHVKQEASTPQVMRPDKTTAPRQDAVAPALRRKASASQKHGQLPAAPAWAADTKPQLKNKKQESLVPAAVAEEERNFSDPMKDRWIDELSGHKARVSFTKGRVKDGCDNDLDQCDRIRNTEDAKLVGVIVKTKRLVDSPLQPVSGSLKSGHYAQGTPAFYID